MKALKYLSFAGKLAGFVTALNAIPFVDPKVGVFVFAIASILKDGVNRIGDLLDDGKANQSFKSWGGSVRDRHGVGISVPAPFFFVRGKQRLKSPCEIALDCLVGARVGTRGGRLVFRYYQSARDHSARWCGRWRAD